MFCLLASFVLLFYMSIDSLGAIVAEDVVYSLVPSTWSSGGTEHRVIQLQSWSHECQEYRDAVAHITAVTNYNVSVQRVVRNEHPLMYASFLLRIEETKRLLGSASLRVLIHDTAASKVDSILQTNLDWRRVKRSKYGKGVSFSTDADYAIKYSNQGNGETRAMLITDVIVGREIPTYRSKKFPPSGYDTTTANRGKVVVKYKDDEFYVKYVVYYTLKKHHHQFHEQSTSRVYSNYYDGSYDSFFDDDFFYD